MPTSYSKFTLDDLDSLGLRFERRSLFGPIAPIAPSQYLSETLSYNQALPLGSEKAKSEFLIAPILVEISKRAPNHFTFFSGYQFDVDKKKGLQERCDFIFSKNENAVKIEAPLFCVVEAKNDEVDNENGFANASRKCLRPRCSTRKRKAMFPRFTEQSARASNGFFCGSMAR